jgi:hypothetical protein
VVQVAYTPLDGGLGRGDALDKGQLVRLGSNSGEIGPAALRGIDPAERAWMTWICEHSRIGTRTGRAQLQHALVRTACFSVVREEERRCSGGPLACVTLAGQRVGV